MYSYVVNTYPTAWSRVLLAKLIVAQMLRKFPGFHETESLLTFCRKPLL
jgi:hypothetical protein